MKLDFKAFYESYASAVKFAEMKFRPEIILAATVAAIAAALAVGSLFDFTLGFLLALVAADFGIGVPFFLAERKVEDIESRLPDVLHHMATTLKTGGTVEVALREVSRVNYGPITPGIKNILREMNEGKPFEGAFSEFAIESRSELLRRAAIIIIAARKAGGGLLDTLAAMAEDIRALARLKRERKTKTFMQFLFIVVAGCFVAPFVFGIVKSVLEILVKVGGQASAETLAVVGQFDVLFKLYLIIESALTMMGAVLVREGKISKAILYLPAGMLVSYIIYTAIASLFLKMIGGG
jgi:pilus assembly protein TadC